MAFHSSPTPAKAKELKGELSPPMQPSDRVIYVSNSPRKRRLQLPSSRFPSRVDPPYRIVDPLGLPCEKAKRNRLKAQLRNNKPLPSFMSYSPVVAPFTTSHFPMQAPKRPSHTPTSPRKRGLKQMPSPSESRESNETKVEFIGWRGVENMHHKRREHLRSVKEKSTEPGRSVPKTVHSIPIIDIHPSVETFDDDNKHAVGLGSGKGNTDRASVLRLFMQDWLESFQAERQNYTSILVHGEIALTEVRRMTDHLRKPNEFVTAFVCMLLEYLAPFFGSYEHLVSVLIHEIQASIYKNLEGDAPERFFHLTPYFARVKLEQHQVLVMHEQDHRHKERNDLLHQELKQLRLQLDATLLLWDKEICRSTFRAMYDVCVVRKRVLAKELKWFAAWASGSPKAIVRRCFEAWISVMKQNIRESVQSELHLHSDEYEHHKQLVTELQETRDSLYEEYQELEAEHQKLYDYVESLDTQEQLAQHYVATMPLREANHLSEIQLRAELVAEIGLPILRSIVRGQSSAGFLQRHLLRRTVSCVSPEKQSQEYPSLLIEQFMHANVASIQKAHSASTASLEQLESSKASQTNIMPAPSRLFTSTSFKILLQALQVRVFDPKKYLLFPATPMPKLGELDSVEESSNRTNADAVDPGVAEIAQQSTRLQQMLLQQLQHYAMSPALYDTTCDDVAMIFVDLTNLETLTSHESLLTPIDLQEPWMPSVDDCLALDALRHVYATGIALDYWSLFHSPIDTTPFARNRHFQERKPMYRRQSMESISSNTVVTILNDENAAKAVMDTHRTWTNLMQALLEYQVLEPVEVEEDEIMPSPPLSPRVASGEMETLSPTLHATTGEALVSEMLADMQLLPVPEFQSNLQLHSDALLHLSTRGLSQSVPSKTIFPDPELIDPSKVKTSLINIDTSLLENLEAKLNIFDTIADENDTCEHEFRKLQSYIHSLGVEGWKEAATYLNCMREKQKVAEATASKSEKRDLRASVYQYFRPECIASIYDQQHAAESPHVHAETKKIQLLLEQHDAIIRSAYPEYDATKHDLERIMQLEDLWSYLRSLRLPRSVEFVPHVTEEEDSVGQIINVSDFGEVIVRLAHEQFPECPILSDAVLKLVQEYIKVTSSRNTDLVQKEMTTKEMKSVLQEHKSYLRGLFKQYCIPQGSKRGSVAPPATPRKASGKDSSPSVAPYMDEYQWTQFIFNCGLVDARFTPDHATLVFSHVQDIPTTAPSSTTKRKPSPIPMNHELQLVYSEFCEALVAIALYKIPDPSITAAAKLNMLILKHLKVAKKPT